MNIWLLAVLLIISIGYILDCLVSLLNLKALSPLLPEEFEGIYDAEKYALSQEYTRVRTFFSLVASTIETCAVLIFLLLGGFNTVDLFARGFGFNQIFSGLIFTGSLLVLSYLLGLPFSIYATFVIEERFGFNRTTVGTFILDAIKAALLMAILGGPLLAVILWFFAMTGQYAWLYCWSGVVCFSILVQFLAPVLIFPLFNKFSPLEEGRLKDQILAYAKKERFRIQGIFTMDGSKRSTKLNAFFTGFGRFRKIVFYDTLMEKLNNEEIVAVLAHEMGHFKLRHIIKMLAGSILQTGMLFYLLTLVMNNEQLFAAFGMEHLSVYASLVFFGFLFSPVNIVVSILFRHFSRKHEFEADAYAVRTTGDTMSLISGLKKLCQANLANLTPHPVAVLLEHTHPPVLQRIKAIRHMEQPN